MLFIKYLNIFDSEHFVTHSRFDRKSCNCRQQACEKHLPSSAKECLQLALNALMGHQLDIVRLGYEPESYWAKDPEDLEIKAVPVPGFNRFALTSTRSKPYPQNPNVYRFTCYFKGITTAFVIDTDDEDLINQLQYEIIQNVYQQTYICA